MSTFTRHPWTRWAVPAVAVVAVGAATGIATVSADASTPLAPRTAEQLLVDLQGATPTGLSGTVVQTSDLGIPSVPGLPSGGGGIGASSDLMSMLSGTHTLRVWYGGPGQTRVALLGSLGESDVIHNGQDVWVWSSRDKSGTHYTVPTDTGRTKEAPDVTQAPLTPDAAAKQALAALDPTTKVTTEGTAKIAGHSAYELVLAPRDPASLVAEVRIAVDSVTHIPLRVEVFSTKASKPAFQVGFTQVDFAKPEARQFSFKAPPGTTVKQGSTPNPATPSGATKALDPPASAPKIVGKGWTTVAVVTLPKDSTTATPNASGRAGLGSLQAITKALPAVSGAWGAGHLFSGTLVSAVLTDDGRVAVGAVTPELLYAALTAK